MNINCNPTQKLDSDLAIILNMTKRKWLHFIFDKYKNNSPVTHLASFSSRVLLVLLDDGSELGYKAYKVESHEDLCNPFVSIYFGAAYLAWLSDYEGR